MEDAFSFFLVECFQRGGRAWKIPQEAPFVKPEAETVTFIGKSGG